MAHPRHFSAPLGFRFGEYELDAERRVLLRDGVPQKLQPQPLRVLEFLLERAPAIVTREELAAAVWSDVNVDIDLSLNYCIRQVRSVLNDSAANPRYVETLPRQGYRFISPIDKTQAVDTAFQRPVTSPTDEAEAATPPVGNPVASIRAGQVVAGKGVPYKRSAVLFTAAALSIMAAVILLVVSVRVSAAKKNTMSSSIRSIAVLPFDNFSGDPSQDYLADGMTDGLTTMLAKNSDLRVISRTSTMQYKGVHKPVREIAGDLGVDGIVEGSLSRKGDMVHMNVQIIQAPSDTHLWADSYDRDAKDLSGLPGEAALSIAKALGRYKPRVAIRKQILPSAHDAYLRGQYLWFNDRTEQSAEYFRKAIALQPDYAEAWSGLAIFYGATGIKGETDPRQTLEPLKFAAHKAVALDDQSPEAHLALASAYFESDWNWAAAEQEIDRTVQLDPNFAEAWHFRSKILAALDRHDEAIASQRKASELNASARPWALALSFMLARRFDEAREEANRRLESNPTDSILRGLIFDLDSRTGKPAEAVASLAQRFRLEGKPDIAEELEKTFKRGAFHAVLRWQLEKAKATARTKYVSPLQMAHLYAQLGQRDEALTSLERASAEHSPVMLWIRCDPAFDFLHSDARYRNVIRPLKFPATPLRESH